MKARRYLTFIALMAMAVSLAGCLNANYYFSFKDEQDLTGADGASWSVDGEGLAGFNKYGYYDNGLWLTAPYSFKGDFKMTVDFWLGATEEKPGHVEVMFSDKKPTDALVSDLILVSMRDLGELTENLYAEDWHEGTAAAFPYTDLGTAMQIPGLNKIHWNRMIIEKKGDSIKVRLNNKTTAQFNVVNCASEYLMVSFLAGNDYLDEPTDPKSGFIIKNVKIEFVKGNDQLLP